MTGPHGWRIALDIQGAQSIEHSDRGIARYVAEFARALHARPGALAALLLNPTLPLPQSLSQELLASTLLQWNTAAALRHAKEDGPIVYHIASPFELVVRAATIAPAHCLLPGIPLVVSLYDLIPYLRQEQYLSTPYARRTYLDRIEMVRTADLVLAISEHTRGDAVEHLRIPPDRVVTAGTGVSEMFGPRQHGEDVDAVLRSAFPAITRSFVLCVSGCEPRKNTERLIDAYGRLPTRVRAEHQLVIVCRLDPHFHAVWRERAYAAGLRPDDVVFTDFVSDTLLRALYLSARVLVFPSLYEGFGLPVAEAAACGCAAITSSTTSLPEILDLPESTFDPLDVDAMSALMLRALEDDAFRGRLIEAGTTRTHLFRWPAVADRVLDAVARVEPRASDSRRVSRRLRILFATPVPPRRSGIADVNHRLTEALRKRCDVDLMPEWPYDLTATLTENGRALTARTVDDVVNPASYDALIYTMGNSEHHHDAYETALRIPGVVWFHDVYLVGLYSTYGETRAPAGRSSFLRSKLRQMYGERAPRSVIDGLEFDALRQYGLRMTVELARSARAIFVNSALAERVLRLDQGAYPRLPPLYRMFLPVPNDIPRRRQSTSRGEAIIATFGIGSPIKAPDVLVDALQIIREHHRARLVLAGSLWEPWAPEIRERAAARDIDGAVEITDDLSHEQYIGWLQRATCAVQLRRWSNGESSAAIRDCIAAGVPVVTNMLGAEEELGDAVVTVPVEATAADVAGAVARLLDDDAHRRAVLAAARSYAESHTAARLADAVLAAIEDLEVASSAT